MVSVHFVVLIYRDYHLDAGKAAIQSMGMERSAMAMPAYTLRNTDTKTAVKEIMEHYGPRRDTQDDETGAEHGVSHELTGSRVRYHLATEALPEL